MAAAAVAIPYIMAAAAVVSAVGAIKSGQDQSAAMEYNARLEQEKAQAAQQQASAQAAIVDQANRRKLGQTAAAYGAAGVEMQGTPLEVMSDQATTGEMNRQLTLYAGTINSNMAMGQSALDSAQASMVQSSSYLSGASSLLGGAGKAMGGLYTPKSTTGPTMPKTTDYSSVAD